LGYVLYQIDAAYEESSISTFRALPKLSGLLRFPQNIRMNKQWQKIDRLRILSKPHLTLKHLWKDGVPISACSGN
jgi:hypothetical protein